ncbi:permease prefix domain 1-containing protein [Zafaria sp. Z1313]|uniref:permease prefix domain 1-containing protein n=1 Tax=unclassified Zafaria TaxID=2828765 RepID=UPI002E784CB4|nr:permease prefix domain 1-containing protein [Zafaria sp. J156]MEE1622049.1 permease prefix domain 1-containing protein [Zafaria sp. J156]
MATLTERYVAAVARSLPPGQRTDVERELAASIADMVADRTAQGEPGDAAERAALLELGDPMRLSADFAGRPLYLIGPALYPDYIRLLKLLLAIVLPILGGVVLIGQLIGHGHPGETASNTVLTLLTVGAHICLWTTVVFAAIERSGTRKPATDWTPDDLPDVATGGVVKIGDTIVAAVLTLGLAAYLVWQQFRSPFSDAEGAPIPALDPALWSFWLPFLVAVLVANTALEFLRYRARGWSCGFFAAHAVLSLAFAGPVVWLLLRDALINPAFAERLDISPDAPASIAVILVIAVVVITVWDLVDSARKVPLDTRARRGNGA